MIGVVVWALVLPAVVAGLAWFISWRLWNGHGAAPQKHWGGPVALAGGYIAAYLVIVSWPPFPPISASHRMFYLAAFACFIALGESWWARHAYTRWPVRICTTALFAGYLLHPLLEHTWGPVEGFLWLGALTVATAVTWGFLETLAEKRSGMSLPIALWLTCAMAGAAFALSGSAFLGQLAGALAAVFGAAVVVSLWAGGFSLKSGSITTFALLFSGLLCQGCFFAELPVVSGLLLLVAPLAAWIGELQAVAQWRPWKSATLRVAAVALFAGIGLAIALAIFLNTPADDYY